MRRILCTFSLAFSSVWYTRITLLLASVVVGCSWLNPLSSYACVRGDFQRMQISYFTRWKRVPLRCARSQRFWRIRNNRFCCWENLQSIQNFIACDKKSKLANASHDAGNLNCTKCRENACKTTLLLVYLWSLKFLIQKIIILFFNNASIYMFQASHKRKKFIL